MSDVPPFLAKLEERDPEFAELVTELRSRTRVEGALSEKTKALLSMALDAALNHPSGTKSLADHARESGATEEEITETIEIVVAMRALQGLSTGAHAFES